MMNIDDRKAFWETQHKDQNIRTLSGCEYKETIEFLKLNSIIEPLQEVLEVGVGLGKVTKGLKNKGCFVSALDISSEAILRVHSVCVQTYLVENIDELPENYFDVILCHNLIQHIPTEMLKVELTSILKALKPGGTFSVEFVSAIGFEDTCVYEANESCYCRSVEFMGNLIKELNPDCTFDMVRSNFCNVGKITGCHVFHITKSGL